MSAGLICDHCGCLLELDSRGEDENGERAAWITVHTSDAALGGDFCTRACAIGFLEDPDVVEAMDAWAEAIAGVAADIRQGREGVEESD